MWCTPNVARPDVVCPKIASPEQRAARTGIDLGRELTEGFAARHIRHKAKQVARHAGFSKSDVEDIQQQLVEHVLENVAAFDPRQGHFNVFVKTVVERYTANILRDHCAEKRDRRQTCSLSTIVDEDDCGPIELGDTIGQDALDARLGRTTREPHDTASLAADVADVVATLPPELRELCKRLMNTSVSKVARELGVPRTTLHERVRKLRGHFAEAGLRDYL
jgi:RNA polymerase sigma-70 factor (ECF subfamily)